MQPSPLTSVSLCYTPDVSTTAEIAKRFEERVPSEIILVTNEKAGIILLPAERGVVGGTTAPDEQRDDGMENEEVKNENLLKHRFKRIHILSAEDAETLAADQPQRRFVLLNIQGQPALVATVSQIPEALTKPPAEEDAQSQATLRGESGGDRGLEKEMGADALVATPRPLPEQSVVDRSGGLPPPTGFAPFPTTLDGNIGILGVVEQGTGEAAGISPHSGQEGAVVQQEGLEGVRGAGGHEDSGGEKVVAVEKVVSGAKKSVPAAAAKVADRKKAKVPAKAPAGVKGKKTSGGKKSGKETSGGKKSSGGKAKPKTKAPAVAGAKSAKAASKGKVPKKKVSGGKKK